MASVKKIETTVDDVLIRTADDEGMCLVRTGNGSGAEVVVSERGLIEATMEYAHERGLRRMRKTPTAAAPKTRKPRKAKAPVDPPADHRPDIVEPGDDAPVAFAQ